ncbi:hypothetical protein [Virgibacillus siamensis]|uniref:hypothetical protein n=1 Tax=Virgibacillus siamensis TaxID=480071 RepID=UPI000986DCF3|nr:hypothetical protein [Virgibacillus siamensis]
MKIKRIAIIAAVCFLATVLSGCSLQSEEEAVQKAEKSAKRVFTSNKMVETNHKLEGFSLYLPERMEVKEASNSNVILEDGGQTYIVFYNSLEGATSKLGYKAAEKDSALLLESFEDDEKFGYIRILSHKQEDNYELQVGVGGVKITTYTSKGQLDSDSEDLMKVAKSISGSNTTTATNVKK